MCYGMGCKYERFDGECRKPKYTTDEDGERCLARCPVDMVRCDSCGEGFWEEDLIDVKYVKDNLPAVVCQDCVDDEDIFRTEIVKRRIGE